MKYYTLSFIFILTSIISFNSCATIEGEKLCKTWYSNGDYGQMTLEITPWEGKFLGYMLSYNDGQTSIKGDKTEDYIVLSDLVYDKETDTYKQGKIAMDNTTTCGISLKMKNDNELTASYVCDGYEFDETWTTTPPSKSAKFPTASAPKKATKEATPSTHNHNVEQPTATTPSKPTRPVFKPKTPKEVADMTPKEVVKEKIPQTPQTPKETKPEIEGTQKKRTFYVVGVHKVVNYSDADAMGKAIEALWTKTYNEDFSSKLKNIADQEHMYVTYSNFESPKGSMTITIGYKVKDLSNVPKGLKGVKVPSNDYLSFELSGQASDYEGEGWNQIYELMAYRDAKSVDYEVYSFDKDYNVSKIIMWVATK